MDPETHSKVVDQIVHPTANDAPAILERLQLASPPTTAEIHQDIEKLLLLPPPFLPPQWLPSYQIHWDHKINVPDLLSAKPAPPPTVLSFVRSGLDGKVIGYTETASARPSAGSASTSMNRAPGPSKNFVRGKSGYVPFWPGGFDDPTEELITDQTRNNKSKKGFRSIPPGFERGLRLPGDPVEDEELVAIDGDVEGTSDVEDEGNKAEDHGDQDEQPLDETKDIDDLLPTSRSNLRPVGLKKRRIKRPPQKRDWAHVIDVNTPLANFHELVPEMAHKYPFELDTFQKQAVYHLEMGDSVFVAAHTSAGKTVVAEYAIALAEKHMTRAIYTSPIKALSNQKFRDFKQTFSASSVGILTGDVQINPEASCLIMTTEILRSMLYKGADLIRDVEFVIFDEVHYVNDAERGVVWEEVIIMLPEHVSIILLSATVPNTKEFADWVGRTKKKDIYVISTPQRPVPLEHYLYAGREMYKIVDAQRNFVSQGYKEAGEALRRKQDKEREAAGLPPVQRVGARGTAPAQRGQQRGGRGAPVAQRGRGGGGGGAPSRTIHTAADKNLYVHLLGHLRKKALLPVVVFTFSKKRCEENAATLTNADLCTSVEKSEVHVAIEKALSRLKGSDKKLPQIVRTRDLLSRGIGIHHGGLLPLVKELVEILFARGLVKILFATETFAMGVNMPAKCVVFSSIRKHDGRSFRDILPGEYTQMAGRAGRRGLDPTGTVIIVANDNLPEQTTLHTMMLGTPGKLSSQFRLTYNMILNLLRVEALRVEEMIKRSFSENSSQRLLPEQQKKVIESEKTLSTLPKLDCPICLPDIHRRYDDSLSIAEKNQKQMEIALAHPQGSKLFSAGRVVVLRDGHFRQSNIAVLLKQAPVQALDSGILAKVKTYFVLALVHPDTKSGKDDIDPDAIPPKWPLDPNSLRVDNGEYELRAVPLTSIAMLSSRTIKVDVNEIVDRHRISRMREAVTSLSVIVEEWSEVGSIPEVDWSRMRSLEFQEILRSRDSLAKNLEGSQCVQCPEFENHYRIIHGQKVLEANIAYLKLALSDQNLELIPDYEQRIGVLKDLKFIDENSTIQLKGRVACEINSANELILTELILENTLAGYEPEEVVALLSCFVFQEKTDVEPVLSPKLETGRDAILAISDRVGRIQDFHKVAVEDFRSDIKFGLVEVVYEWAKGMPFEQITALTDVAEGTIVRVITRLDETCREVRDAARVIGDAELFKKMEEAQIKIKRDITVSSNMPMLATERKGAERPASMSDPFLRGCPIAVGARDRNLDALYSFLVWKMPPYVSCFLPCTLMATPSSPPASPNPEYHSNAEDLTESSNLRKRAREPSRDNFDEGFWDLTDDGRPKTRRVNPQRLAIRLGPDLVAEMEELIVPGAKMPTFAVRKDFQERYCVDRRHIYDYFHSRGLRVAKEDKHTNLIRGRAMKAQAQAQAQAQLAAKATSDKIKEESPSFETALGSPSEEVKENFACPKPRGRPATGRKAMKAQSKKPRTAPRSAATTVKRRKFIGPPSDSQDVYDGSQLQTDITPKLSSSGTDTDSDTETPCPEFSHPCDSSTEETLSTPGSLSASTSLPDFLPSPDDYVAGYYEFTGQPRDSSILDMESTGSGLLDYGCNLDENLLMNELGRGEGYGSVPSNVEPALAGFSEAYYDSTNQCLQPYYDDLMSVSRQSSASGVKNTTMPADSPMTMDLPDLRKWLVDDFDFSPTVMDSREYNPASDILYAANERDPFLPGPHGYNPGTYNPQNL